MFTPELFYSSSFRFSSGEWQTQLSRPQLRALRKKVKDAGAQSQAGIGREGSSSGGGGDSSGDGKKTEVSGICQQS